MKINKWKVSISLYHTATLAASIVIAPDASDGLFHRVLERTKTVGDADADVACLHIVRAKHIEGGVFGSALHLDMLPERIASRQGDGQFLLEEALVDGEVGKIHWRTAALERDARREVAATQVEAPVVLEGELHAGEHAAVPAFVCDVGIHVLHVGVVQTSIEDEPDKLYRCIAQIEGEARLARATDIVIRRLGDVVVHKDNLFDRVVLEAVA